MTREVCGGERSGPARTRRRSGLAAAARRQRRRRPRRLSPARPGRGAGDDHRRQRHRPRQRVPNAMPRCWCCSPGRPTPRPTAARHPTPTCSSRSARRRCGITPDRLPSRGAPPIRATTGRWVPHCARRTKRPVSTPPGCIRWQRSSECSSRRRDSTWSRCWPTPRIPVRSRLSMKPRPPSWREFRCGPSSIPRTG